MKFEEQFPSLKGKMLDVEACDDCNSGMNTVDIFCDLGLLCYRSDIKKHCLDKQRVREIISRIATECNVEHLMSSEDCELGMLWKELEL